MEETQKRKNAEAVPVSYQRLGKSRRKQMRTKKKTSKRLWIFIIMFVAGIMVVVARLNWAFMKSYLTYPEQVLDEEQAPEEIEAEPILDDEQYGKRWNKAEIKKRQNNKRYPGGLDGRRPRRGNGNRPRKKEMVGDPQSLPKDIGRKRRTRKGEQLQKNSQWGQPDLEDMSNSKQRLKDLMMSLGRDVVEGQTSQWGIEEMRNEKQRPKGWRSRNQPDSFDWEQEKMGRDVVERFKKQPKFRPEDMQEGPGGMQKGSKVLKPKKGIRPELQGNDGPGRPKRILDGARMRGPNERRKEIDTQRQEKIGQRRDPRRKGGARPPPREPTVAKKSLEQLLNDGELGKWVLVNLKFSAQVGENKDFKQKVEFVMCRLAHQKYSSNPSKMPFFKDLMDYSRCSYEKNKKIMSWKEAEEYLAQQRVVPPTGFVHHEARVGSTLVANLLASNNETLVYSESQPLVAAANNVCRKCSTSDRVALLQITVKLMGVSDTHKYLFFKAHPVSITEIKLFQETFPDTPYIWMHRDPVEVMMSQLNRAFIQDSERNKYNWVPDKGKTKSKKPPKVAPCLRHLPQVKKMLNLKSQTDFASREEYCAAYLYVICKYAADAIEHDEHGMAVNYSKDLTDRFINFFLPSFFQVNLPPEKKKQALRIAEGYSKASRGRSGDFKGDEKKKQDKAWPYAKEMARQYVDDVYHKLVVMEQTKTEWIKKGGYAEFIKYQSKGAGPKTMKSEDHELSNKSSISERMKEKVVDSQAQIVKAKEINSAGLEDMPVQEPENQENIGKSADEAKETDNIIRQNTAVEEEESENEQDKVNDEKAPLDLER